jgi:hypothetical protein
MTAARGCGDARLNGGLMVHYRPDSGKHSELRSEVFSNEFYQAAEKLSGKLCNVGLEKGFKQQ